MNSLKIGFFLLVALLTTTISARAEAHICWEHHNKVYFNSSGPKLGYLLWGHVVTGDKCWGGCWVHDNGNGVEIDAKSHRKGSQDVATDFIDVMDYERSIIGNDTGDLKLEPDKLNFFVYGAIQMDGNQYELNVGQGYNGRNNWWCGGTGFIGITPRWVICTRDGKYSIWSNTGGDSGESVDTFYVTANGTFPKWMSQYIDDDKKLSEIAIPGTHDSGTYAMNSGLDDYAVCQQYALLAQMYFGIRAFDIRLGVGDDGPLRIFHSFVQADLKFDTVIRQAFEFLDKNPGETIIMFIKQEHGDEDISDKFMSVLKARNPGLDRYWLKNDMPKLGEVRNKIVFVVRDHCVHGDGDRGIYVHWQKNTTFTSKDKVDFFIQDVYNPQGWYHKQPYFLSLQRHALDNPGEYWYINFLSYSDDLPPSSTTKPMNRWASKELYPYGHDTAHGQLTETVMMNFPRKFRGPDVVRDLIFNNALNRSDSLHIEGAEIPEATLTSYHAESSGGNRSDSYYLSFEVEITDEGIDPTQLITPASQVYFRCGEYVISDEDGRLGRDPEGVFPGNSGEVDQGRARIFGYAEDWVEVKWDSGKVALIIMGSHDGENGGPNLIDLSGIPPGDVTGEQEFVLRIGSYIWSGVIGYEGNVGQNSWMVNSTYLCPLRNDPNRPCPIKYPKAR